jgi:RuvB-like protein 2
MADDALELLTRIAMETSLRYAIHIIMTASLVSQKRKSTIVELRDIERVYGLFVDVKRSTKFLMEYQEEFMFNELQEEEKDAADENEMEENVAADEAIDDAVAMEKLN